MAPEGDAATYGDDLLYVERRAQEHTCWTLSATVLASVAITTVALSGSHRLVILFVGSSVGLFFAASAALIRSGKYHRAFKYLNMIIQVSMVSWIIQIDAELADPTYALASIPPLFYALVTALSGITVSPRLCLGAGFLSGLQFLLLYLLYLRPNISEEALAAHPEFGFPITCMKAAVLAGIGVASAILAQRVRNLLVDIATRAQAEARFDLIDRELSVAAQVQSRLIPETLPRVDGWELAAYYEPSRRVGGDAYDVIELPDGCLLLLVADVAGKGYPAALTMASVCAMVRTLAAGEPDPVKIVERLNGELVRSSVGGRFVTLTLLRLDPLTGDVAYVNAGHAPPIIVGKDGMVRHLPAGGPVVGAFEDMAWTSGTDVIDPGGMVMGFTDGLSELRAPDGALFGEHRVAEIMTQTVGEPLVTVRDRLLARATRFLAGGTPNDDMTVLAARRL